jgi:succinate dehydrogenase / fumarate reductase cytochrome b subunit
MPQRPVYLNLLRIHLPVSGWVSILHRLSGALLFLAVPSGVWGLSQSLSDEAGFRRVAEWIGHPFGKLFLLMLTWAFFHHLFAGLRHLVLDAGWGLELGHARRSSIAVLLAGALVTLLLAGKLFT